MERRKLLVMLLVFSLFLVGVPRTASASSNQQDPAISSSPFNVIANPGFELGVNPCQGSPAQECPANWDLSTCEGVPDATVSLDSSRKIGGSQSVEVSTGRLAPTGCFPGNYTGRAVGFSQFRQGLGGQGYNFTQLTDDPAGFSFWFQLQPYNVSTGVAGFEVRLFGAEALAELDYVFDPNPSIGQFQNSTNTHSLLFYGYQPGQWYHFSRDLRADWLTPMGSANTPLSMNWNFTLLQFQGFASQSGNIARSESFWLDNVRAYVGTGSIPNEESGNPRLEVWSPQVHSSNITSLSLTPGTTLTVEVNITGAGPISGFDVALNYNLTVGHNVLQAVHPANPDDPLTGGLFDPNVSHPGCSDPPILALREQIDIPPGTIRYAAVLVGGCTVNGTGILMTLTFQVVGVGATSIDVLQTPTFGRLACMLVGGPPSACITLDVFNAYFRNKPGVPPVPSFTVSPAEGQIGRPLVFNATGSFDPDNPAGTNHGIQSESVVYDSNDNKVYDTGEPVIIGPAPPAGSYLGSPLPSLICTPPNCIPDRPDPHVAFVDSNGNGHWDVGEPVAYDTNITRIFDSSLSSSDFMLSGAAPPDGTALNVDSKLTFYDLHSNGIWDDGYVWSFGDGPGFSTGNFTSHTFMVASLVPATGYFTVRLVVWDSDDSLPARAQRIVFVGDLAPVANFRVSPHTPVVGRSVEFDASASFDPDGRIVKWSWSFGDGSTFDSLGNSAVHVYSSPGTYVVSLTVTDDGGKTASASQTIVVRQVNHDVGILDLQANPQKVVSSQTVTIFVELVNNGNSSETVDVTAYYGTHVAGSLSGVNLTRGQSFETVTIQWDTLGVPAGNYTMSATISLPTDENPSDNNLSDGIVTVLPPPMLVSTPSGGPVGTLVQLTGSGFPVPPYGPSQFQVEITFDDQLIGFASTRDGVFSFNFSVPLSQPGTHVIHALDNSGVQALTGFQVTVTPAQSKIEVDVSTGTIYFPGETALVFVQTRINGQPVSVSNLQIVVVLPSGSNVTLTPVLLAPGEYRAVFTVARTGAVGTYVVIVKARQQGYLDGSTLGSLEVKPTWLQGHSSLLLGATTVLGAVGLIAIAWRQGFLTRKKDEVSN